jgi:integrase
VPPIVLEELGRHIEAFGPGPGGVLHHQRGGYTHSNAFNWLWRSTQRSAGVTGTTWRFHSLRHAFASALISAGCSVKAVADAMGHESPTTTLATYAQLWPGDEDRIRSAIASAWILEDS